MGKYQYRMPRIALLIPVIFGMILVQFTFKKDATAGDKEVAELLLRAGRTALSKGDPETAIEKFRKAMTEHSELIESMYWLGVAFEKKGDRAEALTSFREYVRLFTAKNESGEVSRTELRLGRLATRRVAILGAGERELRKLESGFVDRLYKYAKDNFVRDPALSLKALGVLLDIDPDNKAAQRLFKKLGGEVEEHAAEEPGPPANSGSFKDVKRWTDLIESKAFGRNDSWTYGPESVVIDNKGGNIFWLVKAVSTGTDFAYEMEVKYLSEYERSWCAGLVVAGSRGGDNFVSTIILKTKIPLENNVGRDRTDLAKPYFMPPIELGTWHRIGLLVRGNRLEVWFDGKKIMEHTSETRSDFKGMIGVFQQRSKVEIRRLRLGKID